MPIPGPGTAISLQTIATEFGGTVPHSLSEYYRGGGLVPNSPTTATIPTSGTISLSNFYGTSNRVPIVISTGVGATNFDVYAARGPTYVAGASDIRVNFPLLPPASPPVNGARIGTASINQAAFRVPNQFSPGDTITVCMPRGNKIGGWGGTGGVHPNSPNNFSPCAVANSPLKGVSGSPGGPGGPALIVQRPVTFTSNPAGGANGGYIFGGGGGGGGGGMALRFTPRPSLQGGSYSSTQHLAPGGGGGGLNLSGGSPNQGGLAGTSLPTQQSTNNGAAPNLANPFPRIGRANPGQGGNVPPAPFVPFGNDIFGLGGPGSSFNSYRPFGPEGQGAAFPVPIQNGGTLLGTILTLGGSGGQGAAAGTTGGNCNTSYPGFAGGAGGAGGPAIQGLPFITFATPFVINGPQA